MKLRPTIFLIIGIAFAILAPWLLTMGSLYKIFDFSNTGQIGDTIGGLTSPVINLISAIIIYYSFTEQLNANKIQIKALQEEKERLNEEKEFNLISQLLIELERKIDNFEYYNELEPKSRQAQLDKQNGISANKKTLYKGVNALILFAKYAERHWKNYFINAEKINLMGLEYFPEFYYLINEIKYIITEIESSKHLDQSSKDKLLARTKFIFKCKLETPVFVIIFEYANCNKSDSADLFKEIKNIYDELYEE